MGFNSGFKGLKNAALAKPTHLVSSGRHQVFWTGHSWVRLPL